ncbi:MAG: glycoside hydrolase family 95 protein, partial [Chitinophagales bacterium]|nr:glycoside hydrolase family 95 protein [Chitinophagales bacterium]
MTKYQGILFISLLIQVGSIAQQNEKLWYRQPAAVWTEALPVGNGRLGAMIFGGMQEEIIQLNESTLWSGGPVPKSINPEASQYLPQIRKLLMEDEDYEKALPLVKNMQGLYTESYLPLGDLILSQQFNDSIPTSYYRDLDIKNAISTTRFTIDGTRFTREIFASAPDQVIVVRITSNKPNRINLKVSTKSLMQYRLSVNAENDLIMSGKAPAHVDPSYYNPNNNPVIWEDTTGTRCRGMRYQLTVRVLKKDGNILADTSGLRISGSSEVILLISAATSFNGFDKCPDADGKDEQELSQGYLNKAMQKSYNVLLNNHRSDYRKYYERVSLHLIDTSLAGKSRMLPSDERLQAYSKGMHDPGIEALYFNYGRYLLISSSRPGGLPANLQGIWNKELRAPWSSNFTININTQMNYWPA